MQPHSTREFFTANMDVFHSLAIHLQVCLLPPLDPPSDGMYHLTKIICFCFEGWYIRPLHQQQSETLKRQKTWHPRLLEKVPNRLAKPPKNSHRDRGGLPEAVSMKEIGGSKPKMELLLPVFALHIIPVSSMYVYIWIKTKTIIYKYGYI